MHLKLRERCFDQDFPSSQLHPWGPAMLFPGKTFPRTFCYTCAGEKSERVAFLGCPGRRDTLYGRDFVELAGAVYHFSAEPLFLCKWCWCSVSTQHLLLCPKCPSFLGIPNWDCSPCLDLARPYFLGSLSCITRCCAF